MGRYFFMSEDEWDLFDKDVKTIKEAGERIVCNIRNSPVLGGTRATLVDDLKAELREKTIQLADVKVNLSITEEMRDAVTGRLAVAVADFKSLEVKLVEANVTINQQAHKLLEIKTLVK